jgi:transcriptional regulator GlxA family with amidase domain
VQPAKYPLLNRSHKPQRTVIEEIVRVRLQKAKELLATMKITMLAVSAATGFRHRGKLTRAF